jgi:hypothetical protein
MRGSFAPRGLAATGFGFLLACTGAAQAGDDRDGPSVRFISPITLYDYGGGQKMGHMILRLDDERSVGTGFITSRIDPLRFADGRGRISFFGQSNNALIGVDNGNPVEDNFGFSTIGASPSILGAELAYRLGDGFRLGTRLSVSLAFNRSDINNDFSDEAGCDEREQDRALCLYDASFWLRHRSLGTLTIGRSETASAWIGSISLGGIAFATNSDPTLKGGWHELFGLGRRLATPRPTRPASLAPTSCATIRRPSPASR